ncbi:MAG: ABC transporter ATP-binding protein [Anaerolineales bacterium]
MNNIRRLLKFARPYRGQALLALLLLILVIATDLAFPRLLQRLVDQGVTPRNFDVILNTSLIMIGIAVFNAAVMIANTLLAARVSQYFGADIRSALFRQIQRFSFGNLDHLQTGELMVRLSSDVTITQMMFLLFLRIGTRAPLLMVGSAVLLVVTSPRLAMLMLVILPVTLGILAFFIRRAQPLFLTVQQKLDRLNQVLQENLAGARVVKAFVRNAHEGERFAAANDDLMESTIAVRRLLSVLPPTIFLILNLGVVGVVWFGGLQAIEGALTIGEIMAFSNYLLTTMFPLFMMVMLAAHWPRARASMERIVEVLEAEPEVQDQPQAEVIAQARGRVAFEGVSFSYNHGNSEPVLTDVNLVAEPGQTVAILGATGAGKSSLVHLIPRFYDVTGGRITLDGRDVRTLTQDSLRAQMGVALQEAVLFSGTIRDNIRYGRPDATEEEIVAAAEAAQAHDFILSLPDGYDTEVKERGTNLSGGQKQRLAIARALLVRPAVLILDDSTSAVDVETEAQLQAALTDLMRDRTAFIIAQRISSVLTADKIVVLDRGRVVAEGTHTELLAGSPIYREIYDSQLGGGVGAVAV